MVSASAASVRESMFPGLKRPNGQVRMSEAEYMLTIEAYEDALIDVIDLLLRKESIGSEPATILEEHLEEAGSARIWIVFSLISGIYPKADQMLWWERTHCSLRPIIRIMNSLSKIPTGGIRPLRIQWIIIIFI